MPAMQRSRRLSPIPLAVVGLLALAFGIWLGGHPSKLPAFVRNALVRDEQGRLYQEATGAIQRDYYRKVDPNQLLDTSLGAAVASLHDHFSRYLSPHAYASFNEETSGRFTGIGISIAPDKRKRGVVVRQVFAGSPAQRAGLARGDVIVRAGPRTLKGASLDDAGTAIRGREGTGVRLTWLSSSGRVTKVVERRQVNVPIVQSKLERFRGDPIAWVHLSQFTQGAGGEVGTAVRKLLGRGAKGVILDLRGNGGGLLDEAVATASVFLPDGKVVSTRGRARPEKVYDATGGAISTKVPVVVLVDGGSASASEIVTGALQDRHRATVVGTHTFGKGVFQEVERLSNGGALDITVGEYFTPSGRNLGGGGVRRGAGITPDIRARDNPRTKHVDEGLRAAEQAVAAKM
jgi:carboxyl-terminal processing protease